MGDKPRLLFLSPCWPRQGSTGLAMRVWATSEALGRRYAVRMVVPRPDGLPRPDILPENVTADSDPAPFGLKDRIRRAVHTHAPTLYSRLFAEPVDWPCDMRLPRPIEVSEVDVVHVCRFSMAPYAASFLGRVACRLDLDESEARTRLRIARLYGQNGLVEKARLLDAEARFFAQQELASIPRFDRVYVSSESERQYLAVRGLDAAAKVVPNTVAVPGSTIGKPGPGPPVLLFVGNLHYYPNEDAVRYFFSDIWPRLRQARPDIRVRLAGSGPASLRSLVSSHSAVEWLGFVPDLEPLYREAHLAIVPIRAGGGTRVKILEAFSHRRAVVSTIAGAEGLGAVNGQHLLETGAPGEFASACLRLIGDTNLRDRIALAGEGLAAARYSPRELDALI